MVAPIVLDVDKGLAIGLLGGLKARVVSFNLGTYATGGVALAAADCGLATILFVDAPPAGGYVFSYDTTGHLLLAYKGAGAATALVQVANAADLTAVVARLLVIGT